LTEQLSLDRFVAKSAETTSRGENYSLKSIVHHIGSTANSGHYTADALRIRADETGMKTSWVSFDDGMTSETTSAAVRNSVQNQKSAYMLLYTTV
jgi:ubiquitin C-terminal hydrolase